MAMAFAEVLNEEARALVADGVDVIQFDEPAFNVYMDDVKEWGIAALHRAIEGVSCTTAVHICYGYGIKANVDWKATLGSEWRQYEAIFRRWRRAGSISLGRMPQRPCADASAQAARGQGCSGRRDRCRKRRGGDAGGRGRRHQRSDEIRGPGQDRGLDQLRDGADALDVAYAKLAALGRGAALARQRLG